VVINNAWVFYDGFRSESCYKKKIGMWEVHNVSNVVIYSAWVSSDRCRSESCYKK
jgi:hypothetical protein